MRAAMQGRLLLGLFVLSGFAGLIYQSIWSHYLGLVLGHAAYAQAMVLAIFMGGMALGAWLASRYSLHWGQLLLRYAILELVVGLCGLAFHPFFEGYLALSQHTVLPALASPLAAHTYQWTTAAILILPQCILLGMTFPLMSAAYLRLAPANDGQVLGGLYFSNSLGAALGAMAAVFLLLPAVGMPGAMFTAGLVNVVVALGAWILWKAATTQSQPENTRVVQEDRDPPALVRFLLICAFFTGATSFVYEIGWVRLLNLALGSTLHSFELMLAAFILGLAFGGLWVRQRSARILDTVRSAGWAQVLMGVFALLSVLVFARSFEWVAWLMSALARSDTGYELFMGGSAVVALLVMFPAAFFAGMTLPLFTIALLRAGGSERRIGQVYAANTLGAIVGVLLMMYALIPLLGVQGAVIASALVDIALGLLLLRRARATIALPVAAVAAGLALAAVLWLGRSDPRVLMSGVYRSGQASLDTEMDVKFLRDGKTATVAVALDDEGHAAISTNGKTDASLTLDIQKDPTPDEITMIMAGLLPNLLHPAPSEVAVIGWGSGLTTHTLLGSSKPNQVTTIEIEPAIMDGARLFRARVSRAYDDPRSIKRIDDARTVFAMGNRHYDAIVSEPSNPWVSGVASLFTREFYGFLRGHLRPGGMLVQWIQAYELDGPLLSTMLAALLTEFPNSELYLADNHDLLIVARTALATPMDAAQFARDPLRTELARVGLRSVEDVAMRRIGGSDVLRAYVASYGAGAHSDYFPIVSLRGPRARFKDATATELVKIVDTGMPIAEMLDGYRIRPAADVSVDSGARFSYRKHVASALAERIRGEASSTDYFGAPELMTGALAMREISAGAMTESDSLAWSRYAARLAGDTLAVLTPQELEGVWIRPKWLNAINQPPVVQDVLAALDAASNRNAEMMLPTALAVLDRPAEEMSSSMRELMLEQALLAAAKLRKYDQVLALEDRYGSMAGVRSYQRSFLLAWAQTQARK